MADLTLAEAQDLIQVLKKILQSRKFFLPKSGQQVKLELTSVFSDKDRFTVVANRTGRIVKDKFTLLLLYGKDKGLLRIDAVGADHVNPDGTVVPCPHIHFQTKDSGKWDAWAAEIPAVFGNVEDRVETFRTFLQYCHVHNIASIEICEQTGME